ncbi:MAG: cation diffusion facilitator family transporter [Chloroflexi bacterium]|nr:cation diffusion facilitator family transporter [Chloroflexota bacterium]
MIADGLHARIDGLTSLAVLLAAGGTLIGLPILDPLIGLLIGVAILFITRDAARRIWYRLMDAVDPSIIEQIERRASEVAGVQGVDRVRARWVGHQLFAEMTIRVDARLSVAESHHLAEHAEETLRRSVRHLGEVTLHVHPARPPSS